MALFLCFLAKLAKLVARRISVVTYCTAVGLTWAHVK